MVYILEEEPVALADDDFHLFRLLGMDRAGGAFVAQLAGCNLLALFVVGFVGHVGVECAALRIATDQSRYVEPLAVVGLFRDVCWRQIQVNGRWRVWQFNGC